MVQLAEAYFNGKKVKPVWNRGKFSFEDNNTNFESSESAKRQLFWDMGGITKNRPSIYTLPANPKNEVFVDSGLIWGEDIIDLILADRGKVVLPLRNFPARRMCSIRRCVPWVRRWPSVEPSRNRCRRGCVHWRRAGPDLAPTAKTWIPLKSPTRSFARS